MFLYPTVLGGNISMWSSGEAPEAINILSSNIVGIYNTYNEIQLVSSKDNQNPTWSIISGTLPDNLVLNGDKIAGTLDSSVYITNPYSDNIIDLVYGTEMESVVFNSKGAGTKTWTIESGTLPTGITRSSNIFNGTPTTV